MNHIKIGFLRETKIPHDRRVALPPQQALELKEKFPSIEIIIQPSDFRAYTNDEYIALGFELQEDVSDCDILIGVKEIATETLIAEKTYMFFSHTVKKQPHNQLMLQEIIKKKITLIDFELLTDLNGIRLVAFGRWAGMVGAYNGLLAWGIKYSSYQLNRAHTCHDMHEFFGELDKIILPPIKIVITGGGRAAHGAMEILDHAGIKKVNPQQFLELSFDVPVYTQIDPWHYVRPANGKAFDLEHFFKHPYDYESIFTPYTKVADMLISCHYWDPRSPALLTINDMQQKDFAIKVIADISCDINGSIKSTIRVSNIDNPFYGFNPHLMQETAAFEHNTITVMAVDNLPGEAPRNASIDFGKDLIKKVLPHIFTGDNDKIIENATITSKGRLMPQFEYLTDYVQANGI